MLLGCGSPMKQHTSDLEAVVQNFPLSTGSQGIVFLGINPLSSNLEICLTYKMEQSSNPTAEEEEERWDTACYPPFFSNGEVVTVEDLDLQGLHTAEQDLDQEMKRFLEAIPPYRIPTHQTTVNLGKSIAGGLTLTYFLRKALRSGIAAINKWFPRKSTRDFVASFLMFIAFDYIFEQGLKRHDRFLGPKAQNNLIFIPPGSKDWQWHPLSPQDAQHFDDMLQAILKPEIVSMKDFLKAYPYHSTTMDLPGILKQLALFLQANGRVKEGKSITQVCFPASLTTYFKEGYLKNIDKTDPHSSVCSGLYSIQHRKKAALRRHLLMQLSTPADEDQPS